MPEDAAWADPVAVPDDIRELQADVDAYHRELRQVRRRLRWQRVTATRAWQRWSFPAGVLTGALVLATAVFALLAVDGRGAHQAVAPAALGAPTAGVGQQGGLLPDLTLTTAGGVPMSARAVRPALIALVPLHCRCDALLSTLAGQAEEVQVRLVVIAPAAPDAEVAALPGRLHYADIVAGYDRAGAFAATFGAHGVTTLVVGRDGIVSDVHRDVTMKTRLELPLQEALLVPAPPSS